MISRDWVTFLGAFASGLGDRKWVRCESGVAWRNDVDGMDWLYLCKYPRRGWVRITINYTGLPGRVDDIARRKLGVRSYSTSGLLVERTVLDRELLGQVDWCVDRVLSGDPQIHKVWSMAAEEAEHARRR